MWVCRRASRRALGIAHSGDPLTSEDYTKMRIPEPPITVTEEALLNFNRANSMIEFLVGVMQMRTI